jgi:ABC-type antimicrobial peptide transport system permease subunit
MFDMELTTQKPKTPPKDFFLNLGAIAVLYFLVINLTQLVFQTIDVAFPPTPESAGIIPSISFPIAALIIGFPLYLLLIRIAVRGEIIDPAKRELPVRKWLAYLTLFIAGAAIAIDLIFLLNRFLGGEEITIGFVLKVVAVLVIAGVIFGYYISDLRYQGTRPMRTYFAAGGAVLVITAISFGFLVFGSPATQRALRFDNDRVSDLQTIQGQIISYWQAKNTVPDALNTLNDSTRGVQVPNDPVTGKVYGYEKLSAISFKICADFERESPKTGTAAYYSVPKPISVPTSSERTGPFIGGEYWDHAAGTVCFERTIDPSYFPKTVITPR